MRLLELSVRNILGLKEAFIDFEPGAVAIVGPNGAGEKLDPRFLGVGSFWLYYPCKDRQ